MQVTTDADLIVNRGRGPEIAGTRITVFDVMDYLKHGWHRDRIAALFRLSSRDVQAAIDYIEAIGVNNIQAHEDVLVMRLREELRRLISFKRLNLMETWPVKGPFDVIFCRNVVIYFDKPTQRVVFGRMADLQRTGGHLFIGHSESLFNVCDRYELIGQTTYRKNG